MGATAAFYGTRSVEIPDAIVWKTRSGKHHLDLTLPNGFGLDFDSEALAKAYNQGWIGGGINCNVMTLSVETREEVDTGDADMTAAG